MHRSFLGILMGNFRHEQNQETYMSGTHKINQRRTQNSQLYSIDRNAF